MTGSVPDARSTTRPRLPSSDSARPTRLAHGGIARRIDGLADLDVQQHLRELLHAGRELAQRAPRALHDGEHLQSRDQAVAGRGPIEAKDVARGFAAEDAAFAP